MCDCIAVVQMKHVTLCN